MAAKRVRSGDAHELERMLNQLDRSWDGLPWHGPSVKATLKGVTAAMAAGRPIPNAHGIGELVLHMAAWKKAVALRIGGQSHVPSAKENFPAFTGGATAWKRALSNLAAEHRRLRTAVAALDPERLDQPAVPGGSSCYVQIHGAIQHDLWHAGQIMILRRGVEKRRRSF